MDLHEITERARTVHSAIAADLADAGGVLRCQADPGHEQPLDAGEIATYLRDGWPQHCGQTMLWVTQRLLDEERVTGSTDG